MALSKTVQLQNNFGELSTFEDAYIRVDRIEIARTACNAVVNTYAKKDGVILSSQIFALSVDPSGVSHVKQAYEHLKTLPEFEGAVDC